MNDNPTRDDDFGDAFFERFGEGQLERLGTDVDLGRAEPLPAAGEPDDRARAWAQARIARRRGR